MHPSGSSVPTIWKVYFSTFELGVDLFPFKFRRRLLQRMGKMHGELRLLTDFQTKGMQNKFEDH